MSINQNGAVLPILAFLLLLILVAYGSYYLGVQQTRKPQQETVMQNEDLPSKNSIASTSPSVAPQTAKVDKSSIQGPVQTQSVNSTVLTEKDLSFSVPKLWWSRYIAGEDGSGGYHLNPTEMCWQCDGKVEITIWFSPNTTLVEKKKEVITYTYLENVREKELSVPNGVGVYVEGATNPPAGVPLTSGQIFRTVFFQKGTGLYTISQSGEEYKNEFEMLLRSIKFSQ